MQIQTDPRDGQPQDRSMAARYGQIILSDGLASIPVALYYKQAELELSAQEVWFISAILASKWDEDLPYPSLHQMAAQSGLSRRHLERYRTNLEHREFLDVRTRRDPVTGRDLANAYDFSGLFARLEALLAASPEPNNEIRSADAPIIEPDSVTRDHSFVARFGRVIARAGVASIPQALFTYQRTLQLSAVQVWFVSYIFAHRWSTDLPYPSLKRMAERSGYGQQHLHNTKESLVEAGYLQVLRRTRDSGGQDTNAYDFESLLAALIDQIRSKTAPDLTPRRVPVGAGPREEIVPKYRGHRRSMKRSALRKGGATPSGEGGATPSGEGGATPGGEGGATPSGDEEESNREESNREDSNRTGTPKKGADGDDRPKGTAVANRAEDYSRELGDAAHTRANVTHALRLWQKSGLEEDTFLALMHEARDRLRRYQGKSGVSGVGNKIAYYFRVLEELVAHAPKAQEATPNASKSTAGGWRSSEATLPPPDRLDPDKYLRGKYAHLFNRDPTGQRSEEDKVGDTSIPQEAAASNEAQFQPSKGAPLRGRGRDNKPAGSMPGAVGAQSGTQTQSEPKAEQAQEPGLAAVLSSYGGAWPLSQPTAQRVCEANGWSPAELAVALDALPKASLSVRLEALWAQKKVAFGGPGAE